MLTVIDGEGESSQTGRSIQINAAGLMDISTTQTTPAAAPHRFQSALEDLNDNAKKRLYRGLQKDIAACLKQSSSLLKKKSALMNRGDETKAELVGMQYQSIRLRERALWKCIKTLYEFINATQ
jgi:hypothetical protein